MDDSIIKKLYELQDEQYREFQSSLIPTKDRASIIGVRTPVLKKLAKELKGENGAAFMKDLPHRYFEEDQLHAFLIADIKDYDTCIEELERFLPYVDNWATCDQMNPRVLRKQPEKLMEKILTWLKSGKTYSIRFAIKLLMNFYLDERFEENQLELAAQISSQEYYVQMMIAWYFATALAKQYEAALPYLENHRLQEWIHRKTIQKACESYRITKEQKAYLRTLR
jgi:3-methyladenine DNA glycosylase AlkD